MKIGVIGNGFVGKATFQLSCKDVEVLAYDLNPDLCVPKNLKLEQLRSCEIIFISVPTPMQKNGSCYIKIIESVIEDLKNINYKNLVVLRSTVPPGTSDSFNCCFMPEFLTEKNFLNDFINNEKWVFGIYEDSNSKKNKEILTKLINLSHKNKKIKNKEIVFMKNSEAEMVKLFRNIFLACKVSLCNELEEFCRLKSINYENVRSVATEDKRIGSSHTNVPGHDGKRGFGGTCFPKDINNLFFEMKKINMKSYLVESAINRNNNVDRPKHDWEESLGRAVI